jgi:ATP/maltotriose-dependent transcriptional regulator MalT
MIARAVSKFPWEKLLKVALPLLIDETTKLVRKIRKRKPPQINGGSTPEARINALESYVKEMEEDLKETAEALEKTATELSALASVCRIVTTRVTIALVPSGCAVILCIGSWILIFLRH